MLSLQLFKHVAYYYEYETADDRLQTSQQLILVFDLFCQQ